MVDLNFDQSQVPPQTIEKPTSVTIFGVLNCVFGCYKLYQFFNSCLMAANAFNGSLPFQVILLMCPYIFLSIWLIVLGIGLLRMKKWARRGSVFCASLFILFAVIDLGMPYGAMAIKWSSLPENMRSALVFALLIGIIKSFIYPILLLIFMNTRKVKQAFAAIGG